jgi:hypothetical protein
VKCRRRFFDVVGIVRGEIEIICPKCGYKRIYDLTDYSIDVVRTKQRNMMPLSDFIKTI